MGCDYSGFGSRPTCIQFTSRPVIVCFSRLGCQFHGWLLTRAGGRAVYLVSTGGQAVTGRTVEGATLKHNDHDERRRGRLFIYKKTIVGRIRGDSDRLGNGADSWS
ncbi:hypothetical protein ElyMa_004331700 [Elysia marginata]|uniref:Uncharacterized protein n=1 Tax=Elysia marginata TaxID=1093978 RepID=A0AAV4H228_9GAST|nr:hypothetical protein ElyMa_004331700 [Elysia marginata]